MKGFKKKFFIAVIITSLILGGYLHYTVYTPVDVNDEKNISFIIKKGSSVRQISQTLKDADLIRNSLSFYGFVRLSGKDKDIIAGRYILNKSMNGPQILDKITTATSSEFVITVQEGLTVSDIDDKLLELELISDGDFEKAVKEFDDFQSYLFIDKEKVKDLEFPLEGYLYPDTYFLDPVNFKNENLIYKMVDNFEIKFKDVKPLFDSQERSMHDVITMASILQREVRTEEDFPIVAGILWKRLDSGWHIGADATILYATKKKKVEVEDLKFDSPYNTRLYVGMPPGPICNPDIEHIKAVLEPESSDYWYYLTTSDTGEVIYAKTNEEHNVNKAKHLY